jgi:hypothetical protein
MEEGGGPRSSPPLTAAPSELPSDLSGPVRSVAGTCETPGPINDGQGEMGLGRFELPDLTLIRPLNANLRIPTRNRLSPTRAARSADLADSRCRKLPGLESGNDGGKSRKEGGSPGTL